MRARFTAVRRVHAVIGSKKYGTKPTQFCEPHMNELPVPCQPWEPWYSQQQRSYNKQLYFGLTWFLFSLGMALYTDAMLIGYWGAPCAPAPLADDD